jgi:hypothetical protein
MKVEMAPAMTIMTNDGLGNNSMRQQLPMKTKWVGQEEVGVLDGENGVQTRDF